MFVYLTFSKNNTLDDDCGIVDYGVQLQLRICLAETSSEQSDAFPASSSLCVNGTPHPLQVIDPFLLLRFGIDMLINALINTSKN